MSTPMQLLPFEVAQLRRRRRTAPLWVWTRAIAAAVAITALIVLRLAGRL